MMRCFILIWFILTGSAAFAGTSGLIRGTASTGRVYLLNVDFESSPSFTTIAGTSDCTASPVDGTYCAQWNGEKYAGTYSIRINGTYDNVLLSFAHTAVSDVYYDFWWYYPSGVSGTRIFYTRDSSSGTDILSDFVYSPTNRYDISDGTTFSKSAISVSWVDDQWWHFRIYWKRDTDGTDGIVKVWISDTITDFDGETPTYSSTTVNTSEIDAGAFVLRGEYGNVFVDNLKIWEPDGDE